VPKYAYKCKECDHAFEAVHGMFVKLRNCDECATDGSLFRVPSVAYSTKNKAPPEKKTGEIVKDFIRDAKQEVKEEKKKMKEELDR
jgi:putative FmdB family regulatory protein